MSQHAHESDRKAAYTGLVLGAIAVAVLVVSLVAMTNKKFEAKEQAKPAAGTTP